MVETLKFIVQNHGENDENKSLKPKTSVNAFIIQLF